MMRGKNIKDKGVKKLPKVVLLILFTYLFFSSTCPLYGEGHQHRYSDLDGRIINVTPRNMTLESGEKFNISPRVITKDRFGNNIRFRAGRIQSWEGAGVKFRQIRGELIIVEIRELDISN